MSNSIKSLLIRTPDVLLHRIMNGYQSPGSNMPMPARGGNPGLTDDDVKKVLSFMKSNFDQ